MDKSKSVLVVTVEVDPADEEELNRWYDEEHLPEKLAEPGFIGARRFKLDDGSPKYLVIYELSDPEAATSPAYMRKEPTEWGKSVMAKWKDWSRSVWVDVSA
ncbi:MAG TPA: DUF4286 family protein [Acidimicrobiales bacterium]|nr:DUF4286 family protein [Acidimicrobiales bacterium]